uniref:Peru 2 n=1 Tax=Solanum tuberosum TaxID=4113 RepID=M1B5G6_SOLTU
MSRDCCSWDGVVCDDMTGHVIELDLGCSGLVGTIDSNSSLFQLSHLQRLDLSLNNFSNSHISPEFGRFSSLTHLDLSGSYFSGQIPFEISYLSKLHSFRLSTNIGFVGLPSYFGPIQRLAAHDFKLLLQNLTQLRELDFSFINISSTIPPNFSSHFTTLSLGLTGLYGIIPERIFHLPNLKKLDLSSSYELSGYFPKTKWNNNTSLRKLELSGVNFSDNIPESLGYHLTSLNYFSLSHCKLWGPIPKSLSNLTHIEYLYLDGNLLNGTIPLGMFSLLSLIYLELSHNHFSGQLEDFKSNSLFYIGLSNNQLEGHLPKSIQNLVNLTTLDLSSNNFSGNVDVSLFSNLKQLSYLILSSNNFSGNVDFSLFSNLKQLSYLILSSNNFIGNVDVSLFSDLKQLSYLSLSQNHSSLTNENKVKVTLPGSLYTLQLAACEVKELEFLKSTNHLVFLDLSNNKLQGRIPDWAWSKWMFSLQYLDLSYNMLTSVDSIPLQSLDTIDLRSNLLQGSLPVPPNSTIFFLISQNNLTGEIPASICNLMSLQILDLARNN